MMKLLGGQRAFVAALTALAMLIFGAVLGMPGKFPTIDGTEYSPEHWFNLIGGAVLPIGLLLTNFKVFADAIGTRVNNPSDPFNASDFKSLLKAKEFWVYVVAASVALGQIFGLKVMPEEEQTYLSNGLLTLTSFLLNSWAERPSGMRQDVAMGSLTPIRPNADGDN